MKQTTNMKLNKPEYSDVVDIEKLNENFDKIDSKVTEVSGQIVSSVATTTSNGLMSTTDKAKLDGIASGANKTDVDSSLSGESIRPVQNRVIKKALDGKAGNAVATQSANGLMSSSDKSKLDGIAAGANKTIVDSAMSESSSNPVQNQVVKQYIDSKVFNGGSGGITVDSSMSDTSTNPVQNKTIKAYVDSRAGTTVDAALSSASENPVQNKAVKAALDDKLSKSGGDVSGHLWLSGSITVGRTKDDTGVHLYKDSEGVAKLTSGSADVDDNVTMARLKVGTPTEDDDAATKQYVDDRAAGSGAVRYDAAQTLTFEQKQRARNNIEALPVLGATTGGTVSMCPDFHVVDSNAAVHIVPTKVDDSDYTITLDCGPENWPVRVAGIRTPTDAQTNYAANVAYVKAKIAEAAASGGVDVDNALSATSTNPVQNKAIKAALDTKAGTAVATTSANGLMSAADKVKLDGLSSGGGLTRVTLTGSVEGYVEGYTSATYQQIANEVAQNCNIWLLIGGETVRLASWKRSGASAYTLVFFGAGSGALTVKYEVTASASSASLTVTGS